MNFLTIIYDEVLWRPLFNSLVWIYSVLPWKDLGLAIILLTIVIRIILTPLLLKARKSQKEMSAIQPEMKRIQNEYKSNKEAQSRALMELYAKHKVNPFSGCLIILVQLPILIALFSVFRIGFGEIKPELIYSFVTNPGVLYPISFGILDLSKGNIFLGIIAAITQYLQTKMSMDSPKKGDSDTKGDFTKTLQWQALYFFPALVLLWSYTLPAALTLYWTVLNILGILQEIIWRPEKHGTGINKIGN